MKFDRTRNLAALACAALAIPLIVFTPGCRQECIDRFDCVGQGSGEELICVDNQCVPGELPHFDASTPEPEPEPEEDAGSGMDAGGTDGGEEPDAGEPDAGEPDAGELDAGEPDAGELDAGEMDAGEPVDAGMPVPVTYVAILTAGQEVPPGTSMATGTATCVLSADQQQFQCTVTNTVTSLTAAHIHLGHAGINGPAVHPFTVMLAPTFSETFTFSATDVKNLEEGRFYVNLHTTNGDPAIRGQLLLQGERLYSSQLDGGAGISGAAGFIVNAAQDTLTYELTLFGAMGVGSSHIHQSVDGTILVGLPGIDNDGGFGRAGVDAGDVAVLDADGGYLNVHDMGGTVIMTGDVHKLQ